MRIMSVNLNSINGYYKNSIKNKPQLNNPSPISFGNVITSPNQIERFNKVDDSREITSQDASRYAKKNYFLSQKIIQDANEISNKANLNYYLLRNELDAYVESFGKKLKGHKCKSYKDEEGDTCIIKNNYNNDCATSKITKTDANRNLVETTEITYDSYFKKPRSIHLVEYKDGKMNVLDYDYKKDVLILKQGVKSEDDNTVSIEKTYEFTDEILTSYKKGSHISKVTLANEPTIHETSDIEFNFVQGELQNVNKKIGIFKPACQIYEIPSYEEKCIKKRMAFKNGILETCMDNAYINMREICNNHSINKIYSTKAELMFDYISENEGTLYRYYYMKNGVPSAKYKVDFSFEQND